MITAIDAPCLRKIFEFVAERIEVAEPALNKLDAAIGDGDHGITMRVGFNALQNRLAALPPDASIDQVLTEAGKTFMGATGGAIGVILGSMFVAGGKALKGVPQIGSSELKILLQAMEAAVVKTGKAQPGDKTILDALHAACEALDSTDGSLQNALSRAARAAEIGADATSRMLCRVGRASRLGERVLGHPDPGASSFSLIMRSMAEWVEAEGAVHPFDSTHGSEGL
jgi:phosphoenolpyruvate---glycerone phosphotransferase subunit DhaL